MFRRSRTKVVLPHEVGPEMMDVKGCLKIKLSSTLSWGGAESCFGYNGDDVFSSGELICISANDFVSILSQL